MYLLNVDGKPMEDAISRRALRAGCAERSGGADNLDVREIAELARVGDPVAAELIERTYQKLGEALRPWAIKFEAGAIVVGGSIAKSWDLVGPAMRAGLALENVELRQSVLFDDAALIGAAAHTQE